jgi:hypothetical protein
MVFYPITATVTVKITLPMEGVDSKEKKKLKE